MTNNCFLFFENAGVCHNYFIVLHQSVEKVDDLSLYFIFLDQGALNPSSCMQDTSGTRGCGLGNGVLDSETTPWVWAVRSGEGGFLHVGGLHIAVAGT